MYIYYIYIYIFICILTIINVSLLSQSMQIVAFISIYLSNFICEYAANETCKSLNKSR